MERKKGNCIQEGGVGIWLEHWGRILTLSPDLCLDMDVDLPNDLLLQLEHDLPVCYSPIQIDMDVNPALVVHSSACQFKCMRKHRPYQMEVLPLSSACCFLKETPYHRLRSVVPMYSYNCWCQKCAFISIPPTVCLLFMLYWNRCAWY